MDIALEAMKLACALSNQGALYDCRDGEHSATCREWTEHIQSVLRDAYTAGCMEGIRMFQDGVTKAIEKQFPKVISEGEK